MWVIDQVPRQLMGQLSEKQVNTSCAAWRIEHGLWLNRQPWFLPFEVGCAVLRKDHIIYRSLNLSSGRTLRHTQILRWLTRDLNYVCPSSQDPGPKPPLSLTLLTFTLGAGKVSILLHCRVVKKVMLHQTAYSYSACPILKSQEPYSISRSTWSEVLQLWPV